MLRGRNSEFLELRETSPNCLEVEFSLESKVIEFGLDTEALQLNKSKQRYDFFEYGKYPWETQQEQD